MAAALPVASIVAVLVALVSDAWPANSGCTMGEATCGGGDGGGGEVGDGDGGEGLGRICQSVWRCRRCRMSNSGERCEIGREMRVWCEI